MISREEAIEKLKGLPIVRYGENSDLYKALNQAINDMQKLQKIEKVIDDFMHQKYEGTMAISKKFIEIEQIIKEVE